MSGKTQNRSDRRAIGLFISYLTKELKYSISEIEMIQAPADLKATRNGKTTYYEIKSTTKEDKYFGAATITEWRAALEHPDDYYFVLFVEGDENEDCYFELFTPDEFLEYSTIPPFKVNFNIDLSNLDKKANHKTAVGATKENLQKLIELYDSMKNE